MLLFKIKSIYSTDPYFNNLLFLKYSVEQVERIFRSRRDDDNNLECAARNTLKMTQPPYSFSLEQLSQILSEPEGFKNIAVIIKNMTILNELKVDLRSIVEAACFPSSQRPIEGIVFYLSIFKEKSPRLDHLIPFVYQATYRLEYIGNQLKLLNEFELVDRITAWEIDKPEDENLFTNKRRRSDTKSSAEIPLKSSSCLNLTFINQLGPLVQNHLHHFFNTSTQPIKTLKASENYSPSVASFVPSIAQELPQPTQEVISSPVANLIVDDFLDFNFDRYEEINELDDFPLDDLDYIDPDLHINEESFTL